MKFLGITTLVRPLAICAIAIGANAFADGDGGDIMFENFESNPEQRWRYVSDRVMGGVSTGKVIYAQQEDVHYAHMTGTVSTLNNGGFIQLRTNIVRGSTAQVAGITLRVRGKPQKYFVHLRTRGTVLPWQYYQAAFEISEQWQTVRLPLDQFAPSGDWLSRAIKPASIRSIGVVALGRDHTADIKIAEVGFFD